MRPPPPRKCVGKQLQCVCLGFTACRESTGETGMSGARVPVFRYLGYCPQFKYQIGSTFGNTTHRLLTNPNVAASASSVLTDTFPRLSHGIDKGAFIRTRTASWGDQKLTEKMVPGYTGYIPKMQNHYFGSRYADTCSSAIADFESDQRGHTAKRDDMRTLTALQTGKLKPTDAQKM
ncbi:hypothetical protein Bbelb_403680 [Branchiostoma belcheri]|nr:hypothetical protein Bbelb_403680 [Branchiostoma belcheri]